MENNETSGDKTLPTERHDRYRSFGELCAAGHHGHQFPRGRKVKKHVPKYILGDECEGKQHSLRISIGVESANNIFATPCPYNLSLNIHLMNVNYITRLIYLYFSDAT